VSFKSTFRSYPLLFFRQYLFWLLFFAITRTVFLIYNHEELSGIGWPELIQTYFEAVYVDISMACYLLAIPFICFAAFGFSDKRIALIINRRVTSFLIMLVSSITLAELPIYDEWGHKLTYKALWFLKQPAEVLHTASYTQLISGSIGILVLSVVGIRLLIFMVPYPELGVKTSKTAALLFFLLTPVLLFTGLRGGYRPIPIQVSDAYFSHHNILNTASVNSTFHLLSNVLQNLEAHKPYTFMSPKKATKLLEELYEVKKDTTIQFLTTNRPNVILVVFEGWAADVVEGLGGYSGIAPHFSRLISNGISFDSCYASGNLSDQGMGAVFSAFPAQPKSSIVTQPTKYIHLPCINTSFKNAGYTSSFMFGGQLNYGNIRSYMYYNGFDRITEGKDFESSIYQGRLGVHDGDLLARQFEDLKKEKQPFFSALFTLSTHGPFDFLGNHYALKWGDKEREYINSVHYADSCLNQFMKRARAQPWYENTLFVFISDHHHNTPKGYSYFEPAYRRIPLVFFGDVIKPEFHGYKSTKICSQLDLASTLLHQLKMDAGAFSWSRNLFNPYSKEFAFYTFDEGFGWIRPEGRLVWHVRENRYEFERYANLSQKPRLFLEGKAYLQRISEDFWRY
jgi:phosphoglycerol transferase MdoB-like AlkP superfamily enzyme